MDHLLSKEKEKEENKPGRVRSVWFSGNDEFSEEIVL